MKTVLVKVTLADLGPCHLHRRLKWVTELGIHLHTSPLLSMASPLQFQTFKDLEIRQEVVKKKFTNCSIIIDWFKNC